MKRYAETPTDMSRADLHWTQEDDTLLMDMLGKGANRLEIATVLKRRPRNIYERSRIIRNGKVSSRDFDVKIFSEEFLAKLKKLYYEGVSIKQMAKELDVVPHTVTNLITGHIKEKRSRKIVDKRCHSPELIEQIRHHRMDRKMMVKEIAVLINVKAALVADICNRHGFRKSAKWDGDQWKLLVKMLDDGVSFDEISRHFGRGKKAIVHKLIKANLYDKYSEVKTWYNNERNSTTLNQIIKIKLWASKYRSEQSHNKFDYNLTEEFVVELYHRQAGKCYYSGKPLGFTKGDRDNLSIDRIDSSKGYTKENVVLCASCVNVMKNALTTKELIEYCHLISDLHPLTTVNDTRQPNVLAQSTSILSTAG